MMDLWGDGEDTREMAKHVRAGMATKPICEEGRREGADLEKYVPTWEEFRKLIRGLKSNSAGGVSGLTYYMVKQWGPEVKKRVYESLCDRWSRRESSQKVPWWVFLLLRGCDINCKSQTGL